MRSQWGKVEMQLPMLCYSCSQQQPQVHQFWARHCKTIGSCPFCGEHHNIDKCKEFMRKPYKETKSLFFQKRLYMACGLSDEHIAKNCQNKTTCTVCSGAHLTCLHRKRDEQHDQGTSPCTNVCSLPGQDGGKDHSMIIPVWVRPEGDSSR